MVASCVLALPLTYTSSNTLSAMYTKIKPRKHDLFSSSSFDRLYRLHVRTKLGGVPMSRSLETGTKKC